MGQTPSNTLKSTDENLESLSLIWLDVDANSSRENIEVQKQLRSIINYLKTFQDVTECENYIRSVPDGDRMLFIVSGGLGYDIVPRIHKLRQILSIYIFCRDKKKHEEWVQNFTKASLTLTIVFLSRFDDIIIYMTAKQIIHLCELSFRPF